MAVTKTKSPIPLQYFMDFMSIDPLLFNCLDISTCVMDYQSECEYWWDQWNNGNSMYNREDLAQCMCTAYERVAQYIGIKPTVQWLCDEITLNDNWFTNHPPGTNIENMIFKTDWGMVQDFGQRLLEKLETVQLNYYDEDGDTFREYAEFTYTVPHDVPVCDIKVYFKDTDLEIEPLSLVSYNEATRVALFRIDAWNLVKPELYINRSWRKVRAMQACDIENFVTEVDVYKDTVDKCKPQVEIIYPENHHCTRNCKDCHQPGCVRVINACDGYFKIVPQSYDEHGCVRDKAPCSFCACPYKIKVWYRAGCHKNCQDSCDSQCYCRQIHEAVFMLASVCLPSYKCECGCIGGSMVQQYQPDTSFLKKDGDRFNTPASIKNRLVMGTRVGEIKAQLALDLILQTEQFCARE